MKKDRKLTYKAFRAFISSWYADAMEKFNDNYFSKEDIYLIINHMGTASYVLQSIVKKLEIERRKSAYEAITENNKSLAEEITKDAKNTLQKLEDRLQELKATPGYKSDNIKLTQTDEDLEKALTEDIKNKVTEIKRLSKRIEKTKAVIEQLKPLLDTKENKGPGRPNEGKTKASKKAKEFENAVKKALIIFEKSKKVSASLLQREMNIGFNKASKIVQKLIDDNKVIVSENGTKKLKSLEENNS